MSIPKFNPRGLVLCIFIFAIGVVRILISPGKDFSPFSNFTPLAAMALFGGAYFSNNYKAFGWPLLSLFITDVVLSLTVFKAYSNGLLYSGWYWTYGAFALMTLTGKFLIKKINTKNIVVASVICVFIHWLITDFGVWLQGTMYPKTFAGYLLCLTAAIPYAVAFLAGTLLYSAILFGLFNWMQNRYPFLQISK